MIFFWLCIEMFATVFENFIILKTCENIFEHRYVGRKKQLVFVTMLILTTAYVTVLNFFSFFEGVWAIGTVVLFELYCYIFIKGKNYLKMLIPVILYSAIFEINIMVTYIMGLTLGIPDTFVYAQHDGARLTAIFITKILFALFAYVLVCAVKRENIELKNKETLIITMVFFLTMIASICIIKMQIQMREESLAGFISIICILLTNIFVFVIIRWISKDNKDKVKIAMLEMQISEQKAMIEDTANIGYEIKSIEHDFKHHMFSILGMIEEGENIEAEQYLHNLLKEYEMSIFKYVFIENAAVNSILNMKISRCHMEHIDIKIEVETDFADFEDIDICVLLANLLDNAIESSCMQKNPKIVVKIRNIRNYLNLHIQNKIRKSVLKDNKKLQTTKLNKENHGFGIYSVQTIVEKYEGMSSFYEENEYFIADIWLKKKYN